MSHQHFTVNIVDVKWPTKCNGSRVVMNILCENEKTQKRKLRVDTAI